MALMGPYAQPYNRGIPRLIEEQRLKNKFQIKIITVIIAAAAFWAVLTACGRAEGPDQGGLKMASLQDMPAEVKAAPITVQQAYRFAVANPDILGQIPCYCGCGAMGHTSNYACYVSDVDQQGNASIDKHALGCSICVDITQDTMRLFLEGNTVHEIKAFIDETYSQYGSSNMR
ncbi:MAG: hypothetical protein A2136_02345 [Chloroflexi bacterium RBG_16_54_11]|nr:MAG: hypothetical protein A2136_02345 [Chloroflexi bacterium RBG_16_54_11]